MRKENKNNDAGKKILPLCSFFFNPSQSHTNTLSFTRLCISLHAQVGAGKDMRERTQNSGHTSVKVHIYRVRTWNSSRFANSHPCTQIHLPDSDSVSLFPLTGLLFVFFWEALGLVIYSTVYFSGVDLLFNLWSCKYHFLIVANVELHQIDLFLDHMTLCSVFLCFYWLPPLMLGPCRRYKQYCSPTTEYAYSLKI